MTKLTPVALTAALLLAAPHSSVAQEVGPECRGVAAGTVAAMRAAGELPTQETVEAAIVAARRACAAALQDLGKAPVAASEASSAASGEEKDDAQAKKDEEPSIWDLLTRDRELKPGNERLRRLKTQ